MMSGAHTYSRYIIYVVLSTICGFDSNPLMKLNPFDKQYLSTWFFNQPLHLSGISVAKISVTWKQICLFCCLFTGARIFCRNQMVRPLRWSCQRLQRNVQVQINMELSMSLEPNKSWLSEYLWENLICHKYVYVEMDKYKTMGMQTYIFRYLGFFRDKSPLWFMVYNV